MFFLPRSVRFALFALLSNPWISIGISACLTYSFDPISASNIMNRRSQTKVRLKRLWYVYTAANHELYKKECGAILSEDHHVVGCLHFLLSSAGKNRDCLYKDLSDLIVLYTKEDSTTVQGVKFLLKHKYIRDFGFKFSVFYKLLRAHYEKFPKKKDASPQGMYSIYNCLDMMFAPQKRASSWLARFTGFGKKSSKKFFEGIIEKYDGERSFFHEEVLHLESSFYSLLAGGDVVYWFFNKPIF